MPGQETVATVFVLVRQKVLPGRAEARSLTTRQNDGLGVFPAPKQPSLEALAGCNPCPTTGTTTGKVRGCAGQAGREGHFSILILPIVSAIGSLSKLTEVKQFSAFRVPGMIIR